jgi:hypothetical protein
MTQPGAWRPFLVTFLSVGALGGCDDGTAEPPPADDLLAPPPPGAGVQYRMVTTIEAGSEVEHCQFFRAPPEGLNVSRAETRFTVGSHHVLMYLTPYDAIPTETEYGEAVDTSGVFDCSDGVMDGWAIETLIGGSQDSDQLTTLEFPAGVAMSIRPNAVFLMNAHYVNASAEVLHPEVRMNFFSVPDEAVEIEGGILFWYDIFIRVPGMAEARAEMSCGLGHDVTLVSSTSHMHRRGIGFEAELFPPS